MHNRRIMLGHLPRATLAADLPHRFNEQVKPVHTRMAVRQTPAIGIHREDSPRGDAPIGDKRTAFALFAEAQIFQEQNGVDGKRII